MHQLEWPLNAAFNAIEWHSWHGIHRAIPYNATVPGTLRVIAMQPMQQRSNPSNPACHTRMVWTAAMASSSPCENADQALRLFARPLASYMCVWRVLHAAQGITTPPSTLSYSLGTSFVACCRQPTVCASLAVSVALVSCTDMTLA